LMCYINTLSNILLKYIIEAINFLPKMYYVLLGKLKLGWYVNYFQR